MALHRTPARLNGHAGTLLERPELERPELERPGSEHPGGEPTAADRTGSSLYWQGELDEALMADLMRLGSQRAVRLDAEGFRDRQAVVQRCWYDLDEGRLLVQLREHGLTA